MITVHQNSSDSTSILQPDQAPQQVVSHFEAIESKLEASIQAIAISQRRHSDYADASFPSEEYKTNIEKLFCVLNTLESHFMFLLKVLKSPSAENVELLKKDFQSLAEFYPKLVTGADICLIPLGDALDGITTTMLKEIQKVVEDLLYEEKGLKKIKKNDPSLNHAIIATAKLEAIIEYFPGIAVMEPNDIFTHAKTSAVWKKMHSATKFRWLKSKKAIEESIKPFCSVLILANAVMHKSKQIEQKLGSETLGKLAGALGGVFYAANQERAQTRAELLFANPTMDSAFQVWRLPDNAIVKELFKLTLPPIEYDKKIYVQKLFPPITKEIIMQEYENGTLNTIIPRNFEAPNLVEGKDELIKTIFNKNPERVKIRILAPWQIDVEKKPTGKLRAKISEILNKIQIKDPRKNSFKDNFKGVIIHVHGGGFVSMSSSAHRSYLIRWAKMLNMVVFSIDYGLAPANPYPEGLDDVWQAYNWLINYSESILGIPMDRIVVAGDSAGGNLVASLSLRAIKEGIRVPDGCFLGYPALNLYPKKVIPSYFIAINNNILPYNLLSLCLKAYIPEEFRPDNDPFLSPLTAQDELLAKMPAVRIMTGTDDPLHDDNWQFLNRLQKLNKDVQMTVYEGVPHGFLSMDDLVEYELIIAESVGRLRELFYSVDELTGERKMKRASTFKKLD